MKSANSGLKLWISIYLLAALAYFTLTHLWESASPAAFFWGDSYVNAQELYPILGDFQRHGLMETLLDSSTWRTGLRAPGLYLSASLFLHILGADHPTLVFYQSLLLFFGASCLYWAIYLHWRHLLAALTAFTLLLTVPEAISQAHNFMLEAPAMAGGALAILALVLIHQKRAGGAFLLAGGLILGFMSRQNFAASSILPLLLYISPQIFRSLRAHPLGAVIHLLGPVLFSLFLSGIAFFGGGFYFHPLMWPAILALSIAIYRFGPPIEKRAYLWAFSCAAAIALPWYLGHFDAMTDHYKGSSTGDYLTLSAAPKLMAFELMVFTFRSGSPLSMLLILAGLPLALWRRDRLAILAPIAFFTALATYPLYFHARYLYPVLPFLALGYAYTLARGGRLLMPLALICLLQGGLRAAGWLFPLKVPHYSMDFLSTEMVDWHHEPWAGWWQIKAAGQNLMERHFYTVAPPRDPAYTQFIADEIGAHCGQHACHWWITPPEAGFEPWYQFDGPPATQYHFQFIEKSTAIRLVDGPDAADGVYAFYIYRRPQTLNAFLANQGQFHPKVLKYYVRFGNQNGALIRFEGGDLGMQSSPADGE